MIRQPSPLRVASWTPVATLPASNSQRAVNINGISRPYFGLHFPKACNFKLTKVSSSKLTLTGLLGQGVFTRCARNARLGQALRAYGRLKD